MKTKNLKAGFSLVELMVVVAIIGILASIAVPNFLKFQAKAKQSSAKALLAGLYGAQKTFFSEYNSYHQNMPYVGFVPDGIPLDATNCPVAGGGPRQYQIGFLTIGTGNSILAVPNLPVTCGALVLANYVTNYPANPAVAAPNGWLNTNAGLILTGTTAFRAAAHAVIGQDATRQDQWSIDGNKNLINDQSGI